jgi:hypothetical protein
VKKKPAEVGMNQQSRSSVQRVTWPHHPGRYVHGSKPREEVVTTGALMSIVIALSAQLMSNPKTRETKGGM